MTKDRPRNRPGNGRKSDGFGGRDEGKTRRGASDRNAGERVPPSDAPSGNDKPWERNRPAARAPGDEPRRFQDKPGGRFDKPRGDFRGKPRFEGKNEERKTESFGGKPHGQMRGKRDRFERKPGGRPQHGGQYERHDAAFEENGEVWIWGLHAAGAALANPNRRISKAYVSRNGAVRAGLDLEALPKFAELLDPKEIDLRLPAGAVHQGLAVRCAPLEGLDLSEAVVRPEQPLVILDQVTDPQNVGAVFRSAAAFGIGGVIMQTRNAPALGGALAKAATGAIERVEEIRAVNLSRAIDALRDAGWRVIGLDGSAEQTLDEAFAGDEPLAIVLGAEGAGIRQGVAKACTGLARIPIGAAMESLNVSNAAAIAFYEAAKRGGAAPPPPKPAASPADDEGAAEDEFD
ncbi:MAG: TrmH family RNA methyltransferase [Hyphomonadaceae bacterium]|nr:TrmH family RNA methyltransferase [Hyphomonadaceae bacterium]